MGPHQLAVWSWIGGGGDMEVFMWEFDHKFVRDFINGSYSGSGRCTDVTTIRDPLYIKENDCFRYVWKWISFYKRNKPLVGKGFCYTEGVNVFYLTCKSFLFYRVFLPKIPISDSGLFGRSFTQFLSKATKQLTFWLKVYTKCINYFILIESALY